MGIKRCALAPWRKVGVAIRWLLFGKSSMISVTIKPISKTLCRLCKRVVQEENNFVAVNWEICMRPPTKFLDYQRERNSSITNKRNVITIKAARPLQARAWTWPLCCDKKEISRQPFAWSPMHVKWETIHKLVKSFMSNYAKKRKKRERLLSWVVPVN